MAPKKKANRRQDDDWENEALGEGTTPETGGGDVGEPDKAEEPDAVGGGGALLAAIKKNKQNKKKKDKSANDASVPHDPSLESNQLNGHAELTDRGKPQSAEEVTADDLFPESSLNNEDVQTSTNKTDPSHTEVDNLDGDATALKTKKEKDREKKDREKQRRKEQASKKKSTPARLPSQSTEQEQPAVDAQAPPVTTSDGGKTGKRKVPAALAAIQKQQELLRQQQEAKARADAEEKARIEEDERRAAEEEIRKEEARQRKKEREKERKEQLKKEGKLLTPAQKEQQRRNDLKRQQMMAAGMKVAGMDEEQSEKKKPVYDSKKRRGIKKLGEDSRTEPEPKSVKDDSGDTNHNVEQIIIADEGEDHKKTQPISPTSSQGKASDSDELDDWEKAADAEEANDIEHERNIESQDVTASTKAQPATEEHLETAASAHDKLSGQKRAQRKTNRASSPSTSESEVEVATAAGRAAAQKKAGLASRRKEEHEQALAARSKDNLRSPICCILGHVDTGKTKLLDKIRQTNVQEGEAGGITQQIGATYFPVDALQTKTEVVNKDGSFEFKVPGLLVIDTPGHESFTNLRSRGSSLCNIAILVVDIMHGLEPQTLESMRLLRDRKTPFIVALNKIDRLYSWKKIDNNGFLDSIAQQSKGVQNEFRDRLERTKVAFSEQGFNSELFSENKSMARNVSLVPTSAHTGEGIPDLLKLLVSLTQERMTNQLMYLSEVECTVLEVKVIEGLGTTIDVVLSNGVLREGDRIVLCGLNGAISTNIRALLTPAPLKELRLKSQYVHNQECKASLGVKIAANDLENAIAGSRLLVVKDPEEEDDLEEEVMSDIENLLSRVSKTGRGVSVQASTLGSLEALLEFLKVSKIPVANISIGPVYKRDVMSAGIMLEKAAEYAVMLCFDVKVDKEAQAYADEQGVKIFTADIIYHLFDDFTKHMAELAERKKEESKFQAVFPCTLQPIAVFMKKDPILVGADVTDGILKMHTPIAAVKTNAVTGVKEIVSLGRVTSIEREHKAIPSAKKGSPSVAVKIEGPNQPLYGRHLEEKDTLYSLISRQSIDTLKEFYRKDVSNEEWLLIKKLKPLFDVP